MTTPADWQLPPGVSRSLWDYLHDAELARNYDQRLAGTPLLDLDLRFVERHCPQPGRLIDLGCGTGRLLMPFAKRGFRVLGVDLSEEMLRVAGEKATAAGVAVDLLKANLVELDCLLDGSFDYAACLFSTLGMVAGSVERRRVVEHVRRLLRPGGMFVLHVHNYWFNLWDHSGRPWLLRDLVRSLLQGGEHGSRPMPAHQGIAGLALHHFTRREAMRLLTGTGFQIVEVGPISLRADGKVRWPSCLDAVRAYGYLVAARRPE
jgi:SAM-dependent methyltransferase